MKRVPTPKEYQQAAHALARGRMHRMVKGEGVEEDLLDDPAKTAGAWVSLDVFIPADEVAKILGWNDQEEEHGESER